MDGNIGPWKEVGVALGAQVSHPSFGFSFLSPSNLPPPHQKPTACLCSEPAPPMQALARLSPHPSSHGLSKAALPALSQPHSPHLSSWAPFDLPDCQNHGCTWAAALFPGGDSPVLFGPQEGLTSARALLTPPCVALEWALTVQTLGGFLCSAAHSMAGWGRISVGGVGAQAGL